MSRVSDFGVAGVENVCYNAITSGEIVAGTAAAVAGTAPCRLAWLKADGNNSGTVYVGGSGVTVPDGTADVTTGYPLAAGDVWGPLPITDVKLLYVVASAAGQRAEFFAVS